MAVTYTVAVSPAAALLGQEITATLRCRAEERTGTALTFGHATLVLSLSRIGDDGEPAICIPNVSAVRAGGRLIRTQAIGGVEELAAGETREAEFELLTRFPQLLRTGRYSFTYRLEGQGGGEPAEPATFTVRASPASIPHLIDRCNGENGVRAAALLRKFTGQVYATAEELAQWWQRHGRTLPWAPEGGLVRPSIPLSANQIRRLVQADEELEIPPAPFVYQPDPAVTAALADAIQRGPDADRAAALCRFLAHYPEPSLAGALRALEPVSSPLLDWLLPSRVPL